MNDTIKILISGASGQLGSEFQRYFEDKKVEVLACSSSDLDISNVARLEEIIENSSPDYFINCAAYTAVDNAESDVERCNIINSSALKLIGNICLEHDVKVLHFSTDYVFDGSGDQPLKESDPTAPISIYGLTKRDGERALLETGCKSLILRVSWLYSEFGTNFPKTINRLLEEKGELNIVDDQVSSPTWTKPLVQFVDENIIGNEKLFDGSIYHYAEEGEASWFDIATQINKKYNKILNPVGSHEFLTVAKRPFYSKLDASLAEKKLNLKPNRWQENLADFLKIIRKT